nr:hypothetical protein [Tanacetum cinerariifolium]
SSGAGQVSGRRAADAYCRRYSVYRAHRAGDEASAYGDNVGGTRAAYARNSGPKAPRDVDRNGSGEIAVGKARNGGGKGDRKAHGSGIGGAGIEPADGHRIGSGQR